MDVSRDSMGRTEVALAAIAQDHEAVSQLLKAGHSANARDRKGWTPLHHAAQNANGTILRTLIEHGGGDVNAQNKRKMTPLMVTCKYRNAEKANRVNVVKILLETCDLMTPRDRNQRTHLHFAAKSGEHGIFQLIFDKWKKNDILVIDEFQRSVLFEAVASKDPAIVTTILHENPEDVHKLLGMDAKPYRLLPIHRACQKNNLAIVNSLVAYGQDVNVESGLEFLPLLCASQSCSLDVMDYLLSLPECDINAVVIHRKTSLFQTIVAYVNHLRTNARRENPSKPKPFLTAIFRLLQANVDTGITCAYTIFRTKKHEPAQDALEISVKGGLEDVVTMLTYAGCPLGVLSKSINRPDDELNKYLKLNLELVHWLREYHATPPTLKLTCRRRIREILGDKFRFSVHSLLLPTPLKEYLRLMDLRYFCEGERDFVVNKNADDEPFSDFQYENSIYDSNEHLDSLESLED